MRKQREKDIVDRQIEIKRMETARLLIVRVRVRPDASTSPPTPSPLSSHNLSITPQAQTHHCFVLDTDTAFLCKTNMDSV